jgi:hypothetical protein
MEDIFIPIIQKFTSLGFFNLLTFILALALIYALLKQRKFLGDNPIINAIVSFSIAFFIFAFPILTGISLTVPLTTFFSQAFAVLLLFFIGFLIASLFYPNLGELLQNFFRSRNAFYVMIALSIALFIISGLVGVMYLPYSQAKGPSAPSNVLLLIAGLIILVVVLLIPVFITTGGAGEE